MTAEKDKFYVEYDKLVRKAKFPTVFCSAKGERWLKSGHLWLYTSDMLAVTVSGVDSRQLESATATTSGETIGSSFNNRETVNKADKFASIPQEIVLSARHNSGGSAETLLFPHTSPSHAVSDGQISVTIELVDVFSYKGAYLGSGFYNPRSKIAVRLISCNRNDNFDSAFFRRRLAYALAYRYQINNRSAEALRSCRLIFGEADGFPGLTVDCFDDVLVVEIFTLAMARLWPLLQNELLKLLKNDYGLQIKRVYEKSLGPLRAKEGLEEREAMLYCAVDVPCEQAPAIITENGLKYSVDFINGQKTGYFLDQKDNRALVAQLARGQRVLECFTHTGSFALNALAGGAETVVAVDISKTALEQAQLNAQLNADKLDLAKLTFLKADVFNLLTALNKGSSGPDWDLAAAKGPYGMILLDPPAFAKRSQVKEAAYRGYLEINKQAMSLLPRGGYLVTTSCSHFMPVADFERMLRQAAALAGVTLRLLAVRGQAADHPILLSMPETSYLKTYFLQII